jgi:hypothetical protein
MKFALVLAATPETTKIPVEVAPTVLAVASANSFPAFEVLDNVMSAAVVEYSTGINEGNNVQFLAVRVEDSVAVGDTLAQSGDVWHKATE